MIIPKPKSYLEKGTLSIKAQLCVDKELVFCEKAFKRVFRKLFDVYVQEGDEGIILKYDPSLAENEYKISGRTVYASSNKGGNYGLATMFQLIEKDGDDFILTDVEVVDRPEKEFRAVLVDVARKWHEFSVLIGYVDICYLNKVNYILFHSMDNQSWTLPLRSFPDAATIGRCYTFAEIEYFVEYGHEAGVEIVPDLEIAGHATELIKNCPEDFGNNFDESTKNSAKSTLFGAEAIIDSPYWHSIICVGKKGIFANMRKMYEEIANTFKYSPYMNIMCEEIQHEKWNYCKDCREYMKRNRIASTKELYATLCSKSVDLCLSVGKIPIIAEGFPPEYAHMISKDAIVMAWESFYCPATKLLELGFKVFNMSWKPTYIVPKRNFENIGIEWTISGDDFNVYKWQHWWEKSVAYPDGIEVEPTDAVIGGCMAEFECTYEEEHDKFVLNLPMLADRTWNEFNYYTHKEMMSINSKMLEMESKLY